MTIRYEHDVYHWTQQQVDWLCTGMLEQLDPEHLLKVAIQKQ